MKSLRLLLSVSFVMAISIAGRLKSLLRRRGYAHPYPVGLFVAAACFLVLVTACESGTEQVSPTAGIRAARTLVATPTLRPTATPAVAVQPTAVASSISATPPPPSVPEVTATTAVTTVPTATPTPEGVEFAVIGDYGLAGPGEATIAALVHNWQPDLIITVGDNNYPNGEAATIDDNIGQYYADYIVPYYGSYEQSAPAERNRFFPALGNHDYYSANGPLPYLEYFTLPGNERYYEFAWGPIHFFVLNSDWNEPDGIGAQSVQAAWLQEQMAASTLPWQVVYFHAAPYSSGHHGSTTVMRWPFAEWGADVVLAGHDHHYERLLVNGIPYFVNGLGGGAIYGLQEPLPETVFRFTGEHGAMLVEATAGQMVFLFIDDDGEVIDRHVIDHP